MQREQLMRVAFGLPVAEGDPAVIQGRCTARAGASKGQAQRARLPGSGEGCKARAIACEFGARESRHFAHADPWHIATGLLENLDLDAIALGPRAWCFCQPLGAVLPYRDVWMEVPCLGT